MMLSSMNLKISLIKNLSCGSKPLIFLKGGAYMKLYISAMAKEPSRGVFWLIDDEIVAFPFIDDSTIGVAKSGVTYNHKLLWEDVKPKGCKKPYNYYPRGRVDFTNKGQPVVYMNPNIDEDYISDIKVNFGLRSEPVIRYDSSQHYKCHLDDGWKPDR